MCIRDSSSIIEKSTYDNYEIVVVENNSETKEIFSYYEELKNNPSIRVVTYEGEFNYSAINNLGVSCACLLYTSFALRGVDLDVYQGECVGIIGTNGSGKSTILKIITGVLNETSGVEMCIRDRSSQEIRLEKAVILIRHLGQNQKLNRQMSRLNHQNLKRLQ